MANSTSNLLNIIENASSLISASMNESIMRKSLNLSEMIHRIGAEFEMSFQSCSMELEYKLDNEIEVEVNPILEEVIRNYLSNARKYACGGKRVIIESITAGDEVHVLFRDFGDTIPEEKRSQIFKRSLQLENNSEHGRGLGLAIVRKIMQAHAGEAGVFPNEPRGNVFFFRLPRQTRPTC